jgi:hypothetical protein
MAVFGLQLHDLPFAERLSPHGAVAPRARRIARRGAGAAADLRAASSERQNAPVSTPSALWRNWPGPARPRRCVAPSPISSDCNAPASPQSSPRASASSARTVSIGSPIFAVPEGKLFLFIATGCPRPRNRPHNFSSARPVCARRDCRAALAMTLQCHCEDSDEAVSRPERYQGLVKKADRRGAGGAISAA